MKNQGKDSGEKFQAVGILIKLFPKKKEINHFLYFKILVPFEKILST